MRGLIWRLLAIGALALWTVAALAYGVFLAELPQAETEEICGIRQEVFVPEAWAQAERGPWWQFSSACNDDHALVPGWWALAVLLPALVSARLVRTLLRGGATRGPVARCDA